jgi:hypothetical protein
MVARGRMIGFVNDCRVDKSAKITSFLQAGLTLAAFSRASDRHGDIDKFGGLPNLRTIRLGAP